MIPLLIFISLLAFLIANMAPGDPVYQYVTLGNAPPTLEELDVIRHRYGLDKPIYVRYFVAIGDILKGDWGFSLRTKNPVTDEVLSRLPNTFAFKRLRIGIFSCCFSTRLECWPL